MSRGFPDLRTFLEQNSLDQLLVEIPQTLVWMAGADLIWSPVHGKFAIFASLVDGYRLTGHAYLMVILVLGGAAMPMYGVVRRRPMFLARMCTGSLAPIIAPKFESATS